MFSLDRSSALPLVDQIEARLRALIGSAQLPRGSRLMSIREFAAHLGVSPNTVVTSYDRLVASGLIDSRGTSGFFVSEARSDPDAMALEAGEEQEPIWLAQQAHDEREGVLPASSGALPPSWLEDAIPRSVVQRALSRSSAGMASRCPPQGMPELRERIAMLMRAQGIAADAGRVLTTFGGSQAIDLICRAFLQPGDAVLVEDPGYFLMFGRLRDAGYRLIPVSRRTDGLDLDELEAACKEHRPRLLFMQSVLHNPTGWSSTAANLHRVLVIAQRHGVLVAEDDVHAQFQMNPNPPRLASLSGLQGVIYCSSFCKAFSPALRMGYLAAEPRLLKALMREKIYATMTTAALNEMVLLELLSAGQWRKHLSRLQRKIEVARTAAARQLRSVGMELDPSGAGLFLWGAVPAGVDAGLLVKDAMDQRILLANGSMFTASGRPDPHIRFNVVFSQHPRLSDYLRSRLQAIEGARGALERAASR